MKLHRTFIVITTVIALGIGAPALAQQGKGRPDPAQRAQQIEARLSTLESELQLNDEQQAAWQTFKAALAAQHQFSRGKGKGARGKAGSLTMPERFEQRAENIAQRAEGMRALAAAAADFYATLDDEQKAQADAAFPMRQRGRGPGGKAARAATAEDGDS